MAARQRCRVDACTTSFRLRRAPIGAEGRRRFGVMCAEQGARIRRRSWERRGLRAAVHVCRTDHVKTAISQPSPTISR
jgi:hypothetical protein